MNAFKDVLRLVGIGLLVYASIVSSVAAAIAGSALYAGGFGDCISLFRRRRKEDGENVIPMRKSS